MLRRSRVGVLACCAAVTVVCAGIRAARADEAEVAREPISIKLDAPASCTNREAFVRGVLGRTARVKVVAPADASRQFRVELLEADGAFVGKLTSIDSAGATTERTLDSPKCAELSDGLALVLALAVDPNATIKTTREVQPLELIEQPAVSVSAESPPRSPPKVETSNAPGPESAVPLAARPWRVMARTLAMAGLSVWHEPLLGARAGVGIDSPRFGLVGVSFALDVDYHQTIATEILSTPVVMRFAEGVVQVCPARLEPVPELNVAACLVGEAGALVGEGLVPHETVVRAWGGLGHGISARYWPNDHFGVLLELQQLIAVNRPPVVEVDTQHELLRSGWTTHSLAVGVAGRF